MVSVSIVIPTHNRREFLQEAVESVLQQTYEDFEVIVVDGGSTDGTVEFLQSVTDKRLDCIFHEQPHGVSRARNAGLERATGEYIVFLDDDDRLFEEAIGVLVETIEAQTAACGGVYAANQFVYSSGRTVDRYVNDGRIERFEDASVGGPSCTLVRRSVVGEIGRFDESLPACEDTDFWIRLFERFHMIALDRVLYERRFHEEQMTNDPELMLQGQKRVLEKHRESLSETNLAQRYYAVARSQAELGRIADARATLRKSIRCNLTHKASLYDYFWLQFGSRGYDIARWGQHRLYRPLCDRLGIA